MTNSNTNIERKAKNSPEAGDAELGRRLRAIRTLAGYSQKKSGELIGVSFQQMQKYESGINRVSAMRIIDFSRAYGQPYGYFLDGIDTIHTSCDSAAFSEQAPILSQVTPEGTTEIFRSAIIELVNTAAGHMVEQLASSYEREYGVKMERGALERVCKMKCTEILKEVSGQIKEKEQNP
jgi:transcriptional regulator with XRE-family HTH domain